MQRDLICVGGRRKADPPTLLLFGCEITDDAITAAAYLVLQPIRKLSKPRADIGGRLHLLAGLKPGPITWQPITLTRCR